MRYDYVRFDVLQIRDGRNWSDFSTLTSEPEACNAYALVYRGEWDGSPAEFRIVDASKAITKCETKSARPIGAAPLPEHPRVSWRATVDRITRRWLHDVFTHGGAATLFTLSDVNAERVDAGLSPLTLEDI